MLYLRLKYTTLSGFTYLPGKVGVEDYRRGIASPENSISS